MESIEATDVFLYKYNLGLGIVHSSVVVFGTEYYYSTDGIRQVQPGTWGPGPDKKELKGKTSHNLNDLNKFLEEIGKEKFSAWNYNIIAPNCNTFTEVLLEFLLDDGYYHRFMSWLLPEGGTFNYVFNRVLKMFGSSVGKEV